jgi:excisionase family DNA binding protein
MRAHIEHAPSLGEVKDPWSGRVGKRSEPIQQIAPVVNRLRRAVREPTKTVALNVELNFHRCSPLLDRQMPLKHEGLPVNQLIGLNSHSEIILSNYPACLWRTTIVCNEVLFIFREKQRRTSPMSTEAVPSSVIALARSTPKTIEPILLRPIEVARMLSLGRSTVFNAIAAGELRAVRFGRAVRVPREAVEEWVRTKEASAA